MKRVRAFVLCAAVSGLFQIATAPSAFADPIPILGTAGNFAVLGATTVTNTGSSVILTGNVGVSPGSAVTGFLPGIVNAPGTIHGPDAVTLAAQNDATTAYNFLAGLLGATDETGNDLGGLTLNAGVYKFSSSAQLTGTLTLDAQGSNAALWVFQIGSTLTTASASAVNIINGFGAVYWQVGSSATLGTTTAFEGNIIALASVTMNTGATDLCGSVIARTGAVTLDTNRIGTGCTDTSAGGGPGTNPKPSPEPGTLLLMGTGMVGLVARRRRLAKA